MEARGDANSIAIYSNAFLIYNPRAGRLLRNQELLQRSIEALERRGHRVTARPTTGPNTAPAIVRECLSAGADVILAAGGDGTINEVVNGMAGSRVPLGVLPAGTANVLAVELKIGINMRRAAERLDQLVPERIALGELSSEAGSRYFALMAGAGLDALVVYHLDVKLKAALGKIAYWLAGFGQLGKRLAEMDVTAEGQRIRCSFALASRVRNYGGDLTIARNASLFDEYFEVVLFQGERTFPYMKYLFGVVTNRLGKMHGIVTMRSRSLELCRAADPSVYVQIDGERAGRLPAKLAIVPDALTLLVPPGFRERSG